MLYRNAHSINHIEKGQYMPRTAPTFDGTPTYVIVSFRWIDANGQLESTPYLTTLARATTGNIEAMADALVAASNANLYDIVLETHTSGNASASTATEAPRESVNDFINTLVRDPASRKTQEVAIPAPLDSLFVAGTNIPDTTVTEYQAVNTAANALLPDAYVFVSARFAEHKKVNQKVKF
jgi:hypothetical protein